MKSRFETLEMPAGKVVKDIWGGHVPTGLGNEDYPNCLDDLRGENSIAELCRRGANAGHAQ